MPEIRKSNKPRQGIFISYTRSDGKNFADDLRRRLIGEYHFQVWQDIVELEGGKDWLRPRVAANRGGDQKRGISGNGDDSSISDCALKQH